jgi:hypothetical protein
MEETKVGGPFKEVLNHDIFLNAIYLFKKIPPFITIDLLKSENRKLSVVVDVSCDATNPNNPVPIYNSCTTFNAPCIRAVEHPTNPVDVVSTLFLSSPWNSFSTFLIRLPLITCLRWFLQKAVKNSPMIYYLTCYSFQKVILGPAHKNSSRKR